MIFVATQILTHLFLCFEKKETKKYKKEENPKIFCYGGNCRNPILSHFPKLPENKKNNKIKGSDVRRKIEVKFWDVFESSIVALLYLKIKTIAD